MTLLPEIADEAAYTPLRRRPEVWLPALRAICARHRLDAGALERASSGTHVVFFTGELVIKLFVACWASDVRRERAALERLAGACGAPRIVAEGELEGWPYLVLTRLGGLPIHRVWGELDDAQQARLAGRLGERLAELHATSPAGLERALAPPGDVDWPAFVAGQRRGCRAHHARGGAAPAWLEQVEAFLDRLPARLPLADPGRQVLLHADVTDDHVRVAEGPGGWEVVGLFDYGDAMLGHPAYELAAPLACLTARRPRATRALLDGYGWAPGALTADDLLATLLLHQYAQLVSLLQRIPGPAPRDLADLREAYAPG